MKKILSIALFLLLNVSMVSAAIVVTTDQGKKSYPDGSTLNVKAEKDMNVLFYGVKMAVKKGENVSLKCLVEDGKPMVYVSGDEIKGIVVNNNTFFASTGAVMKVDGESGQVEVLKGNISVMDKKGNTAFLNKGSVYDVDMYPESMKDISVNQKDNTQEEKDTLMLSPSAPRQ